MEYFIATEVPIYSFENGYHYVYFRHEVRIRCVSKEAAENLIKVLWFGAIIIETL